MFERHNNPVWPLPKDYPELSAEGQRQARVAVCRDDSSRTAWLAGHFFFVNHYLAPEGQRFFGEAGLLPPAPGHLDMIGDFWAYAFNAQAHNRGGGKSTIFAKITPLRGIVCWPYREVVVSSASEKLASVKAEAIMTQLRDNERIIADFGNLVPGRNSGKVYNAQHMRLENGSLLEQLTVGSRQRGTRTSWYILDDPEYDPDSNVQERYTELSAKLENHILRVILPMLNPAHMKLFWVGTMLGTRSYLYHVCFSKDPKFRNWMRRVQSGAIKDKDTGKVIKSTWPERFTVEYLEMMRQTMGEHFDSEYMNQPVKEGSRLLTLDAVANEYTVDKLPANLDERNAAHLPDPEAVMTYHYFKGTTREGRMLWQIDRINQKAYFEQLVKVATIDYAKNKTSTSDMKSIVVSGFDARNTQWILDVWAGRLPDPLFIDLVLRFCCAWRTQIIAPEAVSLQQLLVDAITRRLYEGQSEAIIPLDWRPTIVPLNYPKGAEELDKGGRIVLWGQYALPRGGIKVPASYKHKWPFIEMYRQVQYFTRNLSQLRFDDIIDMMAAVKWVPHGRGTAAPTYGRDPIADVVSMIRQNKPYVEGEEALVGMPVQNIRPEYLAALLRKREEREQSEKQTDSAVWDDPVVVA